MLIELPWSYDGRMYTADTVFGRLKIAERTFPPLLSQVRLGKTLGLTLYYNGKRIGWYQDERTAKHYASVYITSEARNKSKGRVAT